MGGNRMGSNPDVEKLVSEARRHGFDVYKNKKGRLVWVAPQEGTDQPPRLVSPCTFTDTRRIKQIQKFLREHGVPVGGIRAKKKAS